jgi:hypothetical protein
MKHGGKEVEERQSDSPGGRASHGRWRSWYFWVGIGIVMAIPQAVFAGVLFARWFHMMDGNAFVATSWFLGITLVWTIPLALFLRWLALRMSEGR